MVFLPNLNEFAAAVGPYLVVLVILMLLDLAFGVIVAIRQKVFEFAKVADFMITNLPKVLFWLAVAFIEPVLEAVVPALSTALGYTSETVFGILAVAFIGSLANHGAALGIKRVERVPGVEATKPAD